MNFDVQNMKFVRWITSSFLLYMPFSCISAANVPTVQTVWLHVSVSCSACLQSLTAFPNCSFSNLLVKTFPLLLSALPLVFHCARRSSQVLSINLVRPSPVYGIWANMTLSINRKYITYRYATSGGPSHRYRKRAQKLVKIGHVVPEICSQTHRRCRYNTPLLSYHIYQ